MNRRDFLCFSDRPIAGAPFFGRSPREYDAAKRRGENTTIYAGIDHSLRYNAGMGWSELGDVRKHIDGRSWVCTRDGQPGAWELAP